MVDLAEPDGHVVVGVVVMWAGALGYPRMTKGYDPEGDILLLGMKADDPELTTENGDLVAYWQAYPGDGIMDPVGVLLRNASIHLGPVCVELSV